MKSITKFVAVSLTVLCLSSFCTQVNAENVQSKEAVVVDLKEQSKLPEKLNLIEGQQVVFENGSAKVTAAETDNKGALFIDRPHNTFNQAARLQATRAGVGEITVTYPAQGQATVLRTYKIEIKVKATPKAPTASNVIENRSLSNNTYPKDVEIAVGESLTVTQPWTRDPGLFDPMPVTATVTITDKNTGDVLKTVVSTPQFNAGAFTMWKWEGLREGTAEITFKNDLNGKEIAKVQVKVKVASKKQEVTGTDDGKTVSVTKGTAIVIKLDGNISTGYTWKVTGVKGTSAQQVGKVEYKQNNPPAGSPPVVGAPGVFEASFDAGTIGKTTIELQYVGPGQSATAAKTFSVEIDVK